MPKKEWPPLGEQRKSGFIYEGDNPVKIPYPGGYYLVKPGEEFLFPEQIGLKLVGRKGFTETSTLKEQCEVCNGTNVHYKDGCLDCKEKPKKSRKKKEAELEDEKPEESTEEIKEESD